jgi:hypothetical protein
MSDDHLKTEEPVPTGMMRETVRSKCAVCHSFAWATPVAPDSTCVCGALKIVNCEIVEGESEQFTAEEFLAAATEQ